MTQYLLNFHHFPLPEGVTPTAAEFEAINKQWQKYIGGIASKGKFISTNRLDQAGCIIGPDGNVEPATAQGKSLIVGTLTFQAKDLDEAIAFAKDCPVLLMGGSVEVRPIIPFEA